MDLRKGRENLCTSFAAWLGKVSPYASAVIGGVKDVASIFKPNFTINKFGPSGEYVNTATGEVGKGHFRPADIYSKGNR